MPIVFLRALCARAVSFFQHFVNTPITVSVREGAGSSASYFLSVKAIFIPSPIKTIPQILFMYVDIFLLFLSLAKIEDAKVASIKHQIVPVVINAIPSVINGKTAFLIVGSINWGRNAIKNKATLGFNTFVNIPSL